MLQKRTILKRDILGSYTLYTPLSINDSLYKLHLSVIRVKGIVWVLICLACIAGSLTRSRALSRIFPHFRARQTKPPATQAIICIPSLPL